MEISNEQYNELLRRIARLENTVNKSNFSAGLVAENAKLRQENIELGRKLFMYSTAFIHYYEDNNGVCKLCTLKEDEVLHEISS